MSEEESKELKRVRKIIQKNIDIATKMRDGTKKIDIEDWRYYQGLRIMAFYLYIEIFGEYEGSVQLKMDDDLQYEELDKS